MRAPLAAVLCLCFVVLGAAAPPTFAQEQNWTNYVRIGAYGLRSDNAHSIVRDAQASGVFGIEVDNDITGRYESFLDPTEKLKAIHAIAEQAHKAGNKSFVYIAGTECITANAAKSRRTLAKEHPDWLQRKITGEPAMFTSGAAFWIKPGDEDVWISPYASEWRKTYMERVRQAKEYIASGDAYQIVVSRRVDTELSADPFTVYRALRSINPSPYLFFLRLGKTSIVGSSPEVLVRMEDGRVEERPIAGTHPRGKDEADDERLAAEMQADPKERAEHVMLVDLGRNDVGRVSQIGSVEVSEFMVVERYSHVMHLVSHVRGRLEEGRDAFHVLEACFPAGTLTGAPKIRAMEIIEELEPTRRGPYGGAVGYISYSGTLDSCITIRTVVCHGGRASIQVGAGIVADSDPKTEWLETCSKARGMILALRMSQQSGGTKRQDAQ